MSFRACIHTKDNGQQCQSPALRNSTHCYFHHQHRRRKLNRQQIDIADINSGLGRNEALHRVLNAVLANRIDPEIARTLIYGIANAHDV
jgi:hypothetical protein